MTSVATISRSDIDRFARSALRSYFDVQALSKVLIEKHSVPKNQSHFARLQAESIRFCLQQALEYRDAAYASTFARPTLVYYMTMSLALAEILFKRDGNFRLSQLRIHHGHHGLDFSVSTPSAFREEVALGSLAVRPRTTGTFAVWAKTARSPSLIGKLVHIKGSGQTSGLRVFGGGEVDVSSPNRYTLLDIAVTCPSIFVEIGHAGLHPRLARAKVEAIRNENTKLVTLNLVIHPTSANLLADVSDRIMFSPRSIDLVRPTEFHIGGGFSLTYAERDEGIAEVVFPLSYTLQEDLLLMSANEVLLNEFGHYYMGSYVAGMYARYYPEYWARTVDVGGQAFQVIDGLMQAALRRAPLLLAGEFRDVLYVME